jgi:type 1 glutamine amidotransferase
MTERRPRIGILAGVGEHADPWHALEATAAAVGDILVDVAPVDVFTTDQAADWNAFDLLVLAVSSDLSAPPPSSGKLVDDIASHHRRGRPLLALHTSSIAFRDDPRWQAILGGRWVRGVSMHPQIGQALVQVTPAADIPAGLVGFERDFVLYDERYSFLEHADDVTVLARHTEDGLVHPLVWGWPMTADRGGVVYDGLGHGVEAFASPEHATWLRDIARALLVGALDHGSAS